MLAALRIPILVDGNTYRAAMAAALKCIASGAPELAQEIHASNELPPFAAFVRQNVLHMVTIGERILSAVAAGIYARTAVVVQATTAQQLLERAEYAARSSSVLEFKFVTPVCVGSGSYRPYTAMPSASYLFGNLAARWNMYMALSGVPQAPDDLDAAIPVLHGNLRTRTVPMGEYRRTGWVGSITFRLPERHRHWYYALAAFAEYSGIGLKTSHGMGRVEIRLPEGMKGGVWRGT